VGIAAGTVVLGAWCGLAPPAAGCLADPRVTLGTMLAALMAGLPVMLVVGTRSWTFRRAA
jgi:hypothetical protein